MSLFFGAPAPVFSVHSHVNPRFSFSSVAGRYILLAFLPEPGPAREAALQVVRDHIACFSDDHKLFFGVLPDEESFNRFEAIPPWRWFLDGGGELRRLYDACDGAGAVVPRWVMLDPSLRVLGWAELERANEVLSEFAGYGLPEDHAGTPLHAPVLILPRVFEPELCHKLIEIYRADGGRPSGVMRERDGKTYGAVDDFKKRADAYVTDPALVQAINMRLARRLVPEVEKAFGWRATKVERYLVARYGAEDGGYFRPHTDNKTPGTAHRKFACSINLNAGDYEGGCLRFPEFGPRTYTPPTGGAVVFSCSLLHEATPVTRGERFAYLPFLYDDEGARIREANLHTFDRTDETIPAPADTESAIDRG
jgi:predicted 2-oxoglutarate/Fe(II)-dependent dioxygenase YbiX